MNWNAASGVFGTEPADACTLSTPTNYGPDRITKNSYDAAGQLMQVTRAFGTAQAQNYATYTYSLNGKQTSVTDANGNLTANSYNGFDRLAQTTFPSKRPTANQQRGLRNLRLRCERQPHLAAEAGRAESTTSTTP